MNDGVFGSLFFLLTGFHGIHVIIGTIFLTVCLNRLINYHFTRQHHVGLELGILY
jgi:cytochrome c oxidase subunit 3